MYSIQKKFIKRCKPIFFLLKIFNTNTFKADEFLLVRYSHQLFRRNPDTVSDGQKTYCLVYLWELGIIIFLMVATSLLFLFAFTALVDAGSKSKPHHHKGVQLVLQYSCLFCLFDNFFKILPVFSGDHISYNITSDQNLKLKSGEPVRRLQCSIRQQYIFCSRFHFTSIMLGNNQSKKW